MVVLVQPSLKVQLIRMLQVVEANPKLFAHHTIAFVGVGLPLRAVKAGVVLESVEEPEPPPLGSGLRSQPPPCYLTVAVLGVPKERMTQNSYTPHSILGTGNKCNCGGRRPKKVKIEAKIGGKGCIGACTE